MVQNRYQSQANFARVVGKSRGYIHDLLSGDRVATPIFIDSIVDQFSIQDPLRTELYRSAAIDHGYKINIQP
jgi:hypothetical protein